jgi:transcriptional regulator with XRE-family HTH domain
MENKTVPGEWSPIFRQYAAEQRYTQAEISRQTGIPLQTINAYFQGLRNPRIENFNKINNLLKITL